MLPLPVVFLIHSQSYMFCLCCNYSRCKVYFHWFLLAVGPSALILDLFPGCPGGRSLISPTVWIFREVCNISLLVSLVFGTASRDVTRVHCCCSLSHFLSIVYNENGESGFLILKPMFLFRSHLVSVTICPEQWNEKMTF